MIRKVSVPSISVKTAPKVAPKLSAKVSNLPTIKLNFTPSKSFSKAIQIKNSIHSQNNFVAKTNNTSKFSTLSSKDFSKSQKSVIKQELVVKKENLVNEKVRLFSRVPVLRNENEKSQEEEKVVFNQESDFAEPTEESANDNVLSQEGLIEETENVKGQTESMKFQAETRQLLDIVAHSLYTDKEVFIRELISNASDALEKARHRILTEQTLPDTDLPLEISIAVDERKRTFTIQDSGIGMSKDELVQNLGTIAHSGSKNFLKKLQESGDNNSALNNIIGQFGVGFYSSFMVSSYVKVYTRGMEAGAIGYCWESNGDGTYKVTEAEGVHRGTKIILTLKDSEKEFAIKQVVERVIKKYSNFVGFDIKLNGAKVNTVDAIWMKEKSAVTPEQHRAFYEYLSGVNEVPTYTLHFSADVPLNIHAIFYIPPTHGEKFGMGKTDPGVNLYSRKVLIQSKAKAILPNWLRFVKGVVDSEDVSLNLSREHLQDSSLIRKLNGVLTRRILKFLDEQLKNDFKKYNEFYDEYNQFIKEGICTDMLYQEELAKLLVFETSKTAPGERITLDQYIARMKPEQKSIYYLTTATRQFAEHSPYFEAYKEKDVEVLFLYGSGDEFVMSTLTQFKKKKLATIENPDSDIKSEKKQTDSHLTPEESKSLGDWFAQALPDLIQEAKPSDRLVNSPAIISDHENASLRRVMRMVDVSRAPPLGKQKIEFNPGHVIIRKLFSCKDSDPALAKTIAEQIFDNALIAAGLLDDSRSMLSRLNNLLDLAMKDVSVPQSK